MELEDAIHTAILTSRRVSTGKSADNIEIGVVAEDKKFRVLTAAEWRTTSRKWSDDGSDAIRMSF